MSNIGTVKRKSSLLEIFHNFMRVKTGDEKLGEELETSLKNIEIWAKELFKVEENSTKTQKRLLIEEQEQEQVLIRKENKVSIKEENEKEI